MSEKRLKRSEPLIREISQFDVDFVIPRIGIDLPLGIDPFLLYKSRDPQFQSLHDQILQVFASGAELVKQSKLREVAALFHFPEVPEIGFGYSSGGKRGSGIGEFLSTLILETLRESPALLERGIKHIEELQLLSVGIGPDRISDMAGGIIKSFLIEYTQRQAELWRLPIKAGMPISDVFSPADFSWHDGYYDLPVSPYDNSAILLVPRRIVRSLPWINYDEFFRLEFASYLRTKRVSAALRGDAENARLAQKKEIVDVSRKQMDRVDRYVATKEKTSNDAQPTQSYIDQGGTCNESERLKQKLASTPTGNAHASDYQRLVLEILNFLFNPELIDGEMEVRTIDGTERRDIIFTNDSDQTFWTYVRQEHSCLLCLFEAKNTSALDNTHLNQTATYIGDRLGRLGFVVTRVPAAEPQLKKAYSIYNDSQPRKIVLILSDLDLIRMLDMRCAGQDPMRHMQRTYREFRQRVQ